MEKQCNLDHEHCNGVSTKKTRREMRMRHVTDLSIASEIVIIEGADHIEGMPKHCITMRVIEQVAPKLKTVLDNKRKTCTTESDIEGVSPVGFRPTRTSSAALGHFVHWANTGMLWKGLSEDYNLVVLGDLWILGRRYTIPRLQDACMTALYYLLISRKSFQWEAYAELVELLQREFEADCTCYKLWRLAEASFMWLGGKDWLIDQEKEFSKKRMMYVLECLDLTDEKKLSIGCGFIPLYTFLTNGPAAENETITSLVMRPMADK